MTRKPRFSNFSLRTVLALAFVLPSLTPCAVPVQSGRAPDTNPENHSSPIRSFSTLVIVDVVVRDSAGPVRSIAREAFHIFEDGHEQSAKIFEEHSSADPSQSQSLPPLPANTYSNFPETRITGAASVILLDALNTPARDQAYVRQQLLEYLKGIPAGVPVAIFTLASRLRIVEGFSTDRSVLLATLGSKRVEPRDSPLAADQNDATFSSVNTGMQELGAPTQALESTQQFQADEASFEMGVRVQMTVGALRQLAEYLGGIPGRKNLIWISGSFPFNLDSDATLSDDLSPLRNYADEIKNASALLSANRVAVYPVDARGLLPSAVFNAANPNRNYSGAAHGSSGSAVSASPLGGGRRRTTPRITPNRTNPNAFGGDNSKFIQTVAAEHATMQQIAEETGGVAFYDTNNLRGAVASALDNGENYYTMAYTPSDRNFDGRFRKIQVKVDGSNYHLLYRQGYFADSGKSATAGTPLTPSDAAIQRGAPPSSQILFKVRVLPSDSPELKGLQSQAGPAGAMSDRFHGKTKRHWIDYAADVHPIAVELTRDGLRHLSLEVIALAYDRDGKLLNVAERPVQLSLQPQQFEQVMHTGLPLQQEIDIPFGEVYLRVAVRDLLTGRIGSTELKLNNPAHPE